MVFREETFRISKLTCRVQPRKYPSSEAPRKVLVKVWKEKENVLNKKIQFLTAEETRLKGCRYN